jgi:nucleoside-diphosphate-sugar epimerase
VSDEIPRVLITGAAGRIGRAVAPRLPHEWDLRLTDLNELDGVSALDITDLDACREAFAGLDAVVHLAGNPSPTATFEELLTPNIVGAYTVAQAAIDCRVRRLVLASSIHAMSGTDDVVQVRSTDRPRPGNLYGATKAWVEALGAWVASSSDTSVVALRIGYFLEEFSRSEVEEVGHRTAWLSSRDAADLIRSAVLAEGVSFFVAYGISANQHRRADLRDTMERLGYRPRDDSWRTDI